MHYYMKQGRIEIRRADQYDPCPAGYLGQPHDSFPCIFKGDFISRVICTLTRFLLTIHLKAMEISDYSSCFLFQRPTKCYLHVGKLMDQICIGVEWPPNI